MYFTFFVMLVACGVLMMPNGHIVLHNPNGSQTALLHYNISLWLFVLLVFIVGCAMGIGKAAVFKHIPTYFPDNVGSVGGLVGMLGGLGGFFLPLMFSYTQEWTGMWSSAFGILAIFVALSLAWMHWTIHRMHQSSSAHLNDLLERPHTGVPSSPITAPTPEEVRA